MSLLLLFNSTAAVVVPPIAVATLDPATLPFFAWGNYADDVTLSGGSWTAGLPLNNLKNRKAARVARSSGVSLAATWFDVDLGSDKAWEVFALLGHNLSLDALYRVRASSDPAFAAAEFDSGWVEAWPSVFNPDDVEWEDDNWWDLKYTEAQRQGLKWNLIVRLPMVQALRYIRVELDDQTNVSSYVQASRLFVAKGWAPSVAMQFGAKLGWVDPSQIQQTYGGAEVFSEKTKFRRALLEFGTLPESEAYGKAYELMRQAGTTREVLFIWKGDDTLLALRRQFVGRLEELSDIDHPYPDRNGVTLSLKEI